VSPERPVPPRHAVEKIVAGGQTGADRAALDFALAHGIPTGGWVPRGRLAEDGRIPERYPGLAETESADPSVRTARNVRDSDATLLLTHGAPTGGSRRTLEEAARAGKPLLHLDLDELAPHEAGPRLRGWLAALRPRVLNVAGPRASEDAGIAAATQAVLSAVLHAG
jgi:hypothetical protein